MLFSFVIMVLFWLFKFINRLSGYLIIKVLGFKWCLVVIWFINLINFLCSILGLNILILSGSCMFFICNVIVSFVVCLII